MISALSRSSRSASQRPAFSSVTRTAHTLTAHTNAQTDKQTERERQTSRGQGEGAFVVRVELAVKQVPEAILKVECADRWQTLREDQTTYERANEDGSK